MIRYTHTRERAFKRMSFFFSVFLSLFLWENTMFPTFSVFITYFYFEYLRSSADNSEIIFSENEYRTNPKKWQGIHYRINLFQVIVAIAGMYRIVHSHDATTILVLRVVVILVTVLMIYWIDFSLSRIFEREREYIWDFALLTTLWITFLGLTLTDQFSYFILLWNVFYELAVFLFYWGFKRQLTIMARYSSEND